MTTLPPVPGEATSLAPHALRIAQPQPASKMDLNFEICAIKSPPRGHAGLFLETQVTSRGSESTPSPLASSRRALGAANDIHVLFALQKEDRKMTILLQDRCCARKSATLMLQRGKIDFQDFNQLITFVGTALSL